MPHCNPIIQQLSGKCPHGRMPVKEMMIEMRAVDILNSVYLKKKKNNNLLKNY